MDSEKEQQYRAVLKAAKSTILDLREQVAPLSEPIAVVGMACLFPGVYPEDAETPERFFRLLLAGTDSVVAVPPERLEQWASTLPPEKRPTVPGLKQAALLGRDVFAFDSAFFGITPAETRMTDPQHLLFLELAQLALWDAGLPPGSEPGADSGVFCGKGGTDHIFDVLGTSRSSADDPYALTGNMHSAMAGRVSYFFDWTGPSVSCETACSTALTATMQAVQSLRRGECRLALAGAVNLLLGPTPSHWLNAMQALAPDGRCKAFAAGADGFGRGEGGGVLVLQRLSEAQQHGSRIHALILGGALGSDGRSRNFTSPSARGQRLVISRALEDAGIAAREVAYVETHGTGTPLGDPIEAESLAAVYGRKENPPLIGSVKSNVAHLEAAAGMASLIKCIMAVREGTLPETLHAETINPLLEPEQLGIGICRESQPWPAGYQRRIAGVSAFAISGGLAHMLIAEPPEEVRERGAEAQEDAAQGMAAARVRLLPLAGRSETLLARQVEEHLERLESGTAFADLCAAASGAAWLHHPCLPERLALCATDEEAPAALRACLHGKRQRALVRASAPKKPPSVTFLYSGQGSQSPGMGRRLYELFPVFRQTLDRCDALAGPRLGASLRQALFSPSGESLHQTRFTQPAIYSHQAALTDLFKSFGITPSAVLGHSIGEYAAAYAAGVFSLEDGLDLTLRRGELVQALRADSGMAAALGSEERVAGLLRGHPDVSIAAVNGADSVTLAGERTALEAALRHLAESGVEHRMMPVSHAFHCPLVEPVLPEFLARLREKRFHAPAIPFLSTCTGGYLEQTIPGPDWPDYFARQMRQPVRFFQAVLAAKTDLFLELGAGPTLTSFGRQIRRDAQWLFAQNPAGQNPHEQRPDCGDQQYVDQMQERALVFSLARLYASGVSVDFAWQRDPYLISGHISGHMPGRRPESAPLPGFLRKRPAPPAQPGGADRASRRERLADAGQAAQEYSDPPLVQTGRSGRPDQIGRALSTPLPGLPGLPSLADPAEAPEEQSGQSAQNTLEALVREQEAAFAAVRRLHAAALTRATGKA